LAYVSEVAEVAEGDLVVTSGIDGIFPKGFVIGHVETVERSGGAYREILVRPAVDFASLEEVLVVVAPPAAGELAAETGTERAATHCKFPNPTSSSATRRRR
jgi:rod shape-determining protein MreC